MLIKKVKKENKSSEETIEVVVRLPRKIFDSAAELSKALNIDLNELFLRAIKHYKEELSKDEEKSVSVSEDFSRIIQTLNDLINRLSSSLENAQRIGSLVSSPHAKAPVAPRPSQPKPLEPLELPELKTVEGGGEVVESPNPSIDDVLDSVIVLAVADELIKEKQRNLNALHEKEPLKEDH
ncbi:MAG: hypothetical protein ACTSX9_04775 [Candidatus Njordarchaeales archaeon]